MKTHALKTGVNLFLASVLLLSRGVALCDEGLCALGDPIACQAHFPPADARGTACLIAISRVVPSHGHTEVTACAGSSVYHKYLSFLVYWTRTIASSLRHNLYNVV